MGISLQEFLVRLDRIVIAGLLFEKVAEVVEDDHLRLGPVDILGILVQGLHASYLGEDLYQNFQ